MYNTLDCKQRSLGPLERLHEELADMRLLNSSLLKEAQIAKNEASGAVGNETVPMEVFQALQSKRETVIIVIYHAARALHWRCMH